MPRTFRGTVAAIFTAPEKGADMQRVQRVRTIAGLGLENDRYAQGEGSWNASSGPGNRQVTLISAEAFQGTGFEWHEARRNIVVGGLETPHLIGVVFSIGGVKFRGVKYCDPCGRPDKLSGKDGFAQLFRERAGVIAEVLEDGEISEGDEISVTPTSSS